VAEAFSVRFLGREHYAIGSGDADGWGAAHHHLPDGIGNGSRACAFDILHPPWQLTLIEQNQALGSPPDRTNGIVLIHVANQP
jgi:hypothetical protein